MVRRLGCAKDVDDASVESAPTPLEAAAPASWFNAASNAASLAWVSISVAYVRYHGRLPFSARARRPVVRQRLVLHSPTTHSKRSERTLPRQRRPQHHCLCAVASKLQRSCSSAMEICQGQPRSSNPSTVGHLIINRSIPASRTAVCCPSTHLLASCNPLPLDASLDDTAIYTGHFSNRSCIKHILHCRSLTTFSR